MNKVGVVFLAFALMLAFAVAPAMALGPMNALDVGNNPRLQEGPNAVEVQGPNGLIEFAQTGRINHFLDANPSEEGIMNNVAIAVDSLSDMIYLGAHANEFMNSHKWIFFSGESTEGGTWGTHGAFYWFLIRFGATPAHALEMATEAPYGIYLRGHNVGWS